MTYHPDQGFSTRAIHVGSTPDPTTGAVVPPIYQVSTYAQDGVGGLRAGYEYSRSANPTRDALQDCLASLEGGAKAFAFASGLAAEDTLLRTVLAPGSHMVLPDDAYGGTFRLVDKVASRWGVEHSAAHLSDLDAVAAAIVPGRTRVVWCETPTNPLLGLSDINGLAELAHAAGAILVVDNTFATPYLQNPIPLGADVVVHSTTKYCGGHSDVVGGALVVAEGATVPGVDESLVERIEFHQNALGAVAGPFDCWLTLRGIKTLGVRMDRHCDNAEAIAAALDDDPRVREVLYPGLVAHPQHDLAVKQMRRFGGMVSIRLRDADTAVAMCAATSVFTLAESLGGIESLIEHPGRMTHASVSGSALEVPEDLVRLSVGIEDVEDLLADLDSALGVASR